MNVSNQEFFFIKYEYTTAKVMGISFFFYQNGYVTYHCNYWGVKYNFYFTPLIIKWLESITA